MRELLDRLAAKGRAPVGPCDLAATVETDGWAFEISVKVRRSVARDERAGLLVAAMSALKQEPYRATRCPSSKSARSCANRPTTALVYRGWDDKNTFQFVCSTHARTANARRLLATLLIPSSDLDAARQEHEKRQAIERERQDRRDALERERDQSARRVPYTGMNGSRRCCGHCARTLDDADANEHMRTCERAQREIQRCAEATHRSLDAWRRRSESEPLDEQEAEHIKLLEEDAVRFDELLEFGAPRCQP